MRPTHADIHRPTLLLAAPLLFLAATAMPATAQRAAPNASPASRTSSAFQAAPAAQTSPEPQTKTAPANPDALTPPPGTTLRLTTHAIGTQNYTCTVAKPAAKPVWTFTEPVATLTTIALPTSAATTSTPTPAHTLHHALAPVPVPNLPATPHPACTVTPNSTPTTSTSTSTAPAALLCPSWRSDLDGSTVWAEKLASLPAGTAPLCPEHNAIPCLLLHALANAPNAADDASPSDLPDPRNHGELAAITHIQRLRTHGGLAPTTACTPGDKTAVPYTADYLFYGPAPIDLAQRTGATP